MSETERRGGSFEHRAKRGKRHTRNKRRTRAIQRADRRQERQEGRLPLEYGDYEFLPVDY